MGFDTIEINLVRLYFADHIWMILDEADYNWNILTGKL